MRIIWSHAGFAQELRRHVIVQSLDIEKAMMNTHPRRTCTLQKTAAVIALLHPAIGHTQTMENLANLLPGCDGQDNVQGFD